MWLFRTVVKLLLFVLDLLVLYFTFAVIGLFWARNRNESLNSSGIPLLIHGNGFHTELYLPVEDSILHHNWLHFLKDSVIFEKHRHDRYISVGWADLEWSIAGTKDKTSVLMAAKTVISPWNRSIMHVQFMNSVHPLRNSFTEKRFLSRLQYEQLIVFLKRGFILNDDKPVITSYRGYYGFDYFFSSPRKYNIFNTCNQWTADALNACNIRNPRFAAFGWSIAYQVKK